MTTHCLRGALDLPVRLASFLVALVLLQGCSEPLSVVREGLRDHNERRAETVVAESQLRVSDDGRVTASGPLAAVSASSIDLAGATFEVTGRTTVSDAAGRSIASKDLSEGTFVDVDGVVNEDGSFEAVTVKEEHTDLICHVPPGNPDRAHTISVGGRALEAHLNHGDYEGECEEVESSDDPEDDGGEGNDPDDEDEESDDPDEEKVAVCHIPRGNPANARTLYVGESDLQDHLDHGDTEGECAD